MTLKNVPTASEAMAKFFRNNLGGVYSTADFNTAVAAGFGRMNTAFSSSKVLVVAENGQYETVQAAIDAAVAEGADADTRYLVIAMPGVKREITTRSSYVDVIYLDAPATTSGGLYPANEPQPELYQLNYPGALVAIRVDDCNSTWLTTSATFDNLTPVAYAANKGVVITHGVVNDYIGDAGKFSGADLKTLYWGYGNALECHSKRHATTPTSHAEAISDIVDAKRQLEDMTVTGLLSPGEKLGVQATGFIQPGGWTGDGYIESATDVDNWLAQLIRTNFVWSQAYAHGSYSAGLPPRHFICYLSPGTLDASASLDLVIALAQPGCRSVLLWHHPDETFKNVVDAIATIRDDRATYPTRRVDAVTCRALHCGLQPPAFYDSTGALMCPLPHGYWEDFEAWPSGAVTLNHQDARLYLSGVSATVETADPTQGQFLRLTTPATGTAICRSQFELRPGRQYLYKARVKSADATSISHLFYAYSYKDDTPRAALLRRGSITIDSSWRTIYLPFSVPMWSDGGGYCEIRVTSTGTALEMDVDDIGIEAL